MTVPDPAGLAAALQGRYRVVRQLAAQGDLSLFLAEDLKHRREVEIQWLGGVTPAPPAGGEGEAAARLQHPHILPLLDAGRLPGGCFFVVPHIEGEPLADRLARAAPLALPDVIRVLTDICEALVHAHAKGLVHGRLGVDSIRLSGRHALVVDFAAALAGPGHRDPMADVEAFGRLGTVLLAAGATGTEDPLSTRPATDPLATLLRRCLGRDTSAHWRTMAEVLHALEPLATPSGGSPPAAVSPRRRKQGRLAALVAAAALVLLITALVWPRLSRHMTQAAPPVLRQITFAGRTREGVISPDGQLVAFSVATPDNTDRLLVQEIAGGEPLEIATGGRIDRLSWSADGSEVRYLQHDGDVSSVRAVSRLGGASRPILGTWPYAFSLSPDGSRVVVASAATDWIGVVGIARSDTTVIRLQDVDYTWIAGFYWSMAGDRIAVLAYQQQQHRWSLVLVDPATGVHQVLLSRDQELGGAAFSPDGRTLYYLESVGQLKAIMRLRLTRDGRADGVPEPVVSGLDPGIRRSDLVEPLTLSVSMDATRMVLVRRLARANLLSRPASDGDGVPVRRLTSGTAINWLARLSPDDARLAYVRVEAGTAKLMVQDLASGAATVLGTADEYLSIAWSPDGRTLAATVTSPDSGGRLELVPVAGGPVRRLLPRQVSTDLTWASDSLLLVQQPGNRTFLRVNPFTGDTSAVPALPPTSGWVFSARVSNRGDRIALFWNRRRVMHGLWVVSLRDTTTLALAEGLAQSPMRWSPDDRTIYLTEEDLGGGRLRALAQPATGGPARVLVTLPAQQLAEDIARDGRTLIVRETDDRADVWLVELPPAR